MGFMNTFHAWVNDSLFIPYKIDWNVAKPAETDPWFVMEVNEESHDSLLFCDTEAGDSVITITGYGSRRYNTYEILEELRQSIARETRGNLPVYDAWKIITTGTISLGTVENQINSYSFEITISWALA